MKFVWSKYYDKKVKGGFELYSSKHLCHGVRSQNIIFPFGLDSLKIRYITIFN